MKVYGVSQEDIQKALDLTNTENGGGYGGNLMFNYLTTHGNRVEFTVRCKSSSGPGHLRSRDGKRRLVAACWHAYRDFMLNVFEINPEAKMVTMYATYEGLGGFRERFEWTGAVNRGSVMFPVSYRDMCDCE